MRRISWSRMTWAILFCLFSSTVVTLRIAQGHEDGASHHAYSGSEDGHEYASPDGDTDAGVAAEGSNPDQEATQTVPQVAEASAGTCDVSSVTEALSGKIAELQAKVQELVSQHTADLNSKIEGVKSSIPAPAPCPTPSSEPASPNTVHKNFDACLDAITADNVPEAITQWDLIEKQTYSPTAKANLLKDILFLSYEKSKGTSVKFVHELMKSSKRYLPSVFDILKEAMKLNSENIFSLAITVKQELGQDSSLFTKLPGPVRSITSGKTVRLSYPCKLSLQKIELNVRDEGRTPQREYWPVVASSTYNLNHTKSALWTFEPTSNGNFHVRNAWFGDYLWIEPNYQNLRTVDESTINRNGTEFSLSLNDDQTVAIHSIFYKSAPVVEGYMGFSRQIETARPLRVSFEQAALAFTVEEVIKTH